MPKTYFIKTFGCQMNKSDSERIATVWEKAGYKKAPGIGRADLVIINVCSVRQRAVDRVYGLIRQLANKSKKPKIVLTGCILPEDKKKLTDKVSSILSTNQPINYLQIPPEYSSKITAYIPISIGCNNFCAYCVVPYVRGSEICRPANQILKEIKGLIKKGYKEIILLGQNVNSYKSKSINFPQLLQKIDDIPGDFWIRFTSPHPKDTTKELIKTMVKLSKICEHIHLPVQAGDNQILKKMNRKYTIEQYKKLIQEIRKKFTATNQLFSISTDIIVGFPQETKKQFLNSAKLMGWAKFDMAYIAQYSPRPGTAAAKFKDNVSPKEKKRREKVLTDILKKTALENNQKYVGKTVDVLIIGKDRQKNIQARTRTFKNVRIRSGQQSIGRIIKLKITKATTWGHEGKPSSSSSPP